jgi:hypothetical protein
MANGGFKLGDPILHRLLRRPERCLGADGGVVSDGFRVRKLMAHVK